MIAWLTADSGAANWAVVALGAATVGFLAALCIALVFIGVLQEDLRLAKDDLGMARHYERTIRARLSRARAALDGKDKA